jgi:hypothetical protein
LPYRSAVLGRFRIWMRAFRIVALAAAAAALVLFVLAPLGGWAYSALRVREGPYGNANRELLAKFSPFPGARQLRIDSSPYYEPDQELFARKLGYTTNVVYEVPRRTRQTDVADHYDLQLAGWKATREWIPCSRIDSPEPCPSILIAAWTKDEASVSLNLDGFDVPRGEPKTYELVVDHRGAVQP